VVGDDAVAGREDVGEVGAHLAVDHDCVLDAKLRSGFGCELAGRSHADDDEDNVGGEEEPTVVGCDGVDLQTAG